MRWLDGNNGHEFEQTLGDSEGQGELECCSPWGHKESETRERLNKNSWFCKGQKVGPAFDNIIMKSSASYILSVQFFFDPTPPTSTLCLSLLNSGSQKADLYHVVSLPCWLLTRSGQWEAPAEMGRAVSLHHQAPGEWPHSTSPALSGFWQHHFLLLPLQAKGWRQFSTDWIGRFTIPCWSP